jgi:hypothetical protein
MDGRVVVFTFTFGFLFTSLPLTTQMKNDPSSNQFNHSTLRRYRDVYPLYWKDVDCEAAPVKDRYLLMSRRNGGIDLFVW